MLSACGNISADNVENNNIETEEGNNITDDELIDLAFKEDEKNDNQGVYEPDFGDDKRSVSDIMIWDEKDKKYIKIDMNWQNVENRISTLFYEYKEDGSLRAIIYDEDREPIEANEPDYIEKQGEIIKE